MEMVVVMLIVNFWVTVTGGRSRPVPLPGDDDSGDGGDGGNWGEF